MYGRPVVLYRGSLGTTMTELFKNHSANVTYVITGVNIGNTTSGNLNVHISVNDVTFADGLVISSKEIRSWTPNTTLQHNDSISMHGSAEGLVVTIDGLAYWN